MHQSKISLLPLLLLPLLLLPAVVAEPLTVGSDGVIRNLKIRVACDVEVDEGLVNKSEALLLGFNGILASATAAVGRRLTLGTAQLMVPTRYVQKLKDSGKTFTSLAYFTESPEFFIRKHVTKADHDQPYETVQPLKKCGQPGKQILLDANDIDRRRAGWLVHTFARLRYGVFPETMNNLTNVNVYKLADKVYAGAVCSSGVPGRLYVDRVDKGDFSSRLFHENKARCTSGTSTCSFHRTPSTFDLNRASVLHDPTRFGSFCDFANHSSEAVRHDPRGDTDQNNNCNRQSVAEVMRQHADFKAGAASSTQTGNPDLQLVAGDVSDVVLVFDNTGSMSFDNRMENLKMAAGLYLKYFLSNESRVAMVNYSTKADVLKNFTLLSSETIRQQFIDAIASMPAEYPTDICSGILMALHLLSGNPPYTKSVTGRVVLFTDGEHNENITCTNLDEAIDIAANTSVVFDTVTLGSSADLKMQTLSERTGGKAFYSSASSAATDLLVAFSAISAASPGCDSSSLLRAENRSVPFTITQHVDKQSSKKLEFVVSLPGSNPSSLIVEVTSPSGETFTKATSPSMFTVSQELRSIVVKIPSNKLSAGNWTLDVKQQTRKKRSIWDYLTPQKLHNTVATTAVISVIGSSSSELEFEAFLLFNELQQVTADNTQRVFAHIRSDGRPLLGATVRATVADAEGVSTNLLLRDNGASSDAIAGDGIYTGTVLPSWLTNSGDYSVTVKIESPITRITSAGKFRVITPATSDVFLPPGTVRSVTAVVQDDFKFMMVQFVCSGDQADFGTASSYKVKVSNSLNELISSFTSLPELHSAPALSPGSQLTLNIPVSHLNLTADSQLYLSVAAVSQAGRHGDPSFVIFVEMPVIFVQRPGTVGSVIAVVPDGFKYMIVQFVCSGDQGDTGTASKYILKANQSVEEITKNFASLPELHSAQALPPGRQLTLNISVSQLNLTADSLLYVSVAAVSQAGRQGDPSFAVAVQIDEPERPKPKKDSGWTAGWIVAVTLQGVVSATLTIVIVVLMCKWG